MAIDVTMKAGRLFSNELRKLAKAMNQRMVELEKRGYESPAYRSIQARLETLGVKTRYAGGRRFSETGYFKNKNEMMQVEAALRRFKEQETSTLRGYKKYRKEVLNGLEDRYNYKQYGISDDDVMDFWEAMPDDEKERMYGSDETFIIVMAYMKDKKQGKIKNENALTIAEIVEKINNSKSLSNALKSLGLDEGEYLEFKSGKIASLGYL